MTTPTSTGNSGPVILCVSSGKGGVGKSSFSTNIAASLAGKNKQVLLIDGDLGLANVDVLLGITVRRTIRETIEQGLDPLEALVEVVPGFYVLPASSGVPEMANLSYEEQAFLTSTLEEIIGRFDFVLVDTAAGIGESVLWFNTWARENIVILTPDPTAMTDAYALIKVLHTRHGKKRFHLVINSVKNKKEGKEVFDNMSGVLENFLRIKPLALGSMPQDTTIARAIRLQKPFFLAFPDSRASQAIDEMAAQILKMKYNDTEK